MIEDQVSIDKKLIELDGTNNKSKIGANTTIAVSMASLKAAAAANKTSIWEYLNNSSEKNYLTRNSNNWRRSSC